MDIAGLLPLVLIVVVFYFLLIRPQRNRQRDLLALQKRLTPGQEIVTTSGLYGTVVAVDGDSVSLETSPGVVSRWARGAVARVVTPGAPAGDDVPGDGPPDGSDETRRDEGGDAPPAGA